MKYIATTFFAFFIVLASFGQMTISKKTHHLTYLESDSGLHISNARQSFDYGSVKLNSLDVNKYYLKYDTLTNFWLDAKTKERQNAVPSITLINFRGEMRYKSEYIEAELNSFGRNWYLIKLGDTTNLLPNESGDIKIRITAKTLETHQHAVLKIEGKPTANIITAVPQGNTRFSLFKSKKRLNKKTQFDEFTIVKSNGEKLNFESGQYYLFAAKTLTIQ
jgi:hypothetical protein